MGVPTESHSSSPELAERPAHPIQTSLPLTLGTACRYLPFYYETELFGTEAEVKELELVELLGSLQRRVMRKLSGQLETVGLSMSEGVVLWRLHKLGACRVSEIAIQSGLPPSTLTGLLDRLVAGGWVEREADPDDRRAVVMRGTPKLDEFSKTSMRSVARELERGFRGLPKDLIARLVGDLRLVLDCLENEEGSKK